MRKFLIPVLAIFLTGCADIRNRISPDMLAVGTHTLAMHISGEEDVITAQGDAHNFPDLMSAAAGAEISAGHISVLILNGNPADILPDYIKNGWLVPTAQVIDCADAVSLLKNAPPSADDLKSAAETGLIPPRTADTVLGDLLGGSGVTAVTLYTNDGYRLAVYSDSEYLGKLSESACRGLSLLCGRYRTFTVSDAECCVTLEHAEPQIRAEVKNNHLQISVSGTFRCRMRRGNFSDAANLLTGLMSDALTESVTRYGADLLNLQERAETCAYSRETWRKMLQNADIEILPLTIEPAEQYFR